MAIGRAGEQAAADFLAAHGYRIVARNVRFRHGELDIIAEEAGVLVFVEVKTRTGVSFGTATEAVTASKQARLIRLAQMYLLGAGITDRPCRFDVVAVEPSPTEVWRCTVVRDAFTA